MPRGACGDARHNSPENGRELALILGNVEQRDHPRRLWLCCARWPSAFHGRNFRLVIRPHTLDALGRHSLPLEAIGRSIGNRSLGMWRGTERDLPGTRPHRGRPRIGLPIKPQAGYGCVIGTTNHRCHGAMPPNLAVPDTVARWRHIACPRIGFTPEAQAGQTRVLGDDDGRRLPAVLHRPRSCLSGLGHAQHQRNCQQDHPDTHGWPLSNIEEHAGAIKQRGALNRKTAFAKSGAIDALA